ncbi:hypothetical protein SAMD00019534_074140, partial [Acytostelium subglobosum LB1]|uniref:hypothetical protein n=1 Tax=Acytostelium subglobosum LB1 TaxID=1410327 RepID=UPI000644E00F
MDTRVMATRDDNVQCSSFDAHVDEYVKANVFCCSCEKYLCNKCDLIAHKQLDNVNNSESDLHIRMPVDHQTTDDEDDDTKQHQRQQHQQQQNKKQQEQKVKLQKNGNTNRSNSSLPTLGKKTDSSNTSDASLDSTINKELLITPDENDADNKRRSSSSSSAAELSMYVDDESDLKLWDVGKGTNSCALEPDEEDTFVAGEDPKDQKEASHVGQGVLEGIIDLGTGIADGFTGVISDPLNGAKEGGVKGFFKGMGKGISGVALKPVKGSAEFMIKTAEGFRNTGETIFTPKSLQIDVVREKEAIHLLDGLFQGTLGLGRGVFEGVTGIIAEPVKGAQENGGKGFFIGLGKGLVGAVCRPISGAMEFVSKPIEGLVNTPQTIIDAIETKIESNKQKQRAAAGLAANDNNNKDNNNKDNTEKSITNDPISTTSPKLGASFRPSQEEQMKTQDEYNKKWLEKNQKLDSHSISSINFRE